MEHADSLFAVYHQEKDLQNGLRDLAQIGIAPSNVVAIRSRQLSSQGFKYERFAELKEGLLLGSLLGAVAGTAAGVLFDKLPLFNSAALDSFDIALICAASGLVIGAAIGALVGFGSPERTALLYARHLNDGEILVSIHFTTPEHCQKAGNVLRQTGAFEIQPKHEADVLAHIGRHWYRDPNYHSA